MPPFRPPKDRIESVANQVVAELQKHGHITVERPEVVKGAVRKVLTEDLRAEHDLEEEALEMLRSHGQTIYKEGADFQKLLHDGKKILAKKKGFTL